jgi:uncharacterized protein
MLLLDVNICLCAYRPAESESPAVVSKWLGPRLVGHERIAVSEPVLASVIRIATRPNVSARLRHRQTSWRSPSRWPRRRRRSGSDEAASWAIVTDLVKEHRLRGNNVPGAVLAAHALELGATLVTLDPGIARFWALRPVSPLAGEC